MVRRALGLGPNPDDRLAIAIRGYAPEPAGTGGVQVILTTEQRWPAYAWSFPLGDGRANVGYGELVSGGVNREGLLAGLDRLLPGVEADRAQGPPAAAVDRASAPAGRPGAARRGRRLADQPADRRGHLLRRAVRRRSPVRRRRVAATRARPTGGRCRRGWAGTCGTPSTASWASRWPSVMDAVFRAAADDQRVFDDVVALGLADGRLTTRTLAAAARRLR